MVSRTGAEVSVQVQYSTERKEMEEIMISVPYGDFVDGVQACADLDSIRAMITEKQAYCSDSIMAILGLPIKENNPFPEKVLKGYEV